MQANSESLHRLADISSVEVFLEVPATRSNDKVGPLCVKLPRVPDAREQSSSGGRICSADRATCLTCPRRSRRQPWCRRVRSLR